MGRTKLSFGKLDWNNLLEMAAVGLLLAGGFPVRSVGQQQGQKAFSSSENAINALVAAAQNNDEEAMLDVLGPDGKQIVASGDKTEDAQNRANFVQLWPALRRSCVAGSGCGQASAQGPRQWIRPLKGIGG